MPLGGNKNAKFEIVQSAHGPFSHKGKAKYSVDFKARIGTPVVAARAGIVVAARGDSTTGCDSEECAVHANYVYVDHGDGTVATYLHLKAGSLKVKVGDQVCQGDRLGSSGNTGWTKGPHLHFDISDVSQSTLPLRFYEIAKASNLNIDDVGSGVPIVGMKVSPAVTKEHCLKNVAYSACGQAFDEFGVLITNNISCTTAELGRDYTIVGRVIDTRFEAVMISQKMLSRERIPIAAGVDKTCVRTEKDGTFRATIHWPFLPKALGVSGGMFVTTVLSADRCVANVDKHAWLHLQKPDR